ncbi:PD40 domain-containing protein [Aliiglaciecola sp. M165]|uniref:TolB family protein n=1 Tax=Aliiglaciecola sp. M165 TaxID=2593649 RepID=UPI00163D435A|nr:PD40 domain-containing protein [Aliiglaciecola sp. M165]
MKKIPLLSILGLGFAFAQALANDEPTEERQKINLPHSDIFVFDLDTDDKSMSLANLRNITNRKGYDNQPYFTKNSDTLIYSRGDDYQTDVYEYSFSSKRSTQLTDSPATEFSPTPSPDNTSVTFVSDRNGGIWTGERKSLNQPRWLLKQHNNQEPVGYFAWDHDSANLLYWSRYGFSIALTNVDTGAYRFISGNTPPSTPHVIPSTNKFSFVHRQTNGQVWIKELDPKTLSIRPLVPVMGSNHNYTWTPTGEILMIQQNVLYRVNPSSDETWAKVADLAEFQLTNANRLAVSPDGKMLAVVGKAEE